MFKAPVAKHCRKPKTENCPPMSSTVESPASSNYVDYDEFVDYQLKKTRSEIKWTEILTTLAGIFALTLSYLFVFTILDHWVIEGGFSRGVRSICLLSLTTICVAWTVWKIVLPMWKEVHSLYAARMIEEHVPNLKSSLLNLIDLQRSGRETNPSIKSALEKRSAVELSHVDMDHVIVRYRVPGQELFDRDRVIAVPRRFVHQVRDRFTVVTAAPAPRVVAVMGQ